jgi:endonuclease G
MWVAYVLTPDHAIGCEKRSNAFKADRSLPVDKRADVRDYAKSGYDIGHIANSADMSWDFFVGIESFILSNMAPQLPEFNRGIWKKLEDQTRAWVHERNSPVLIYAGPIYNQKQDPTIGAGMVTVPNGFYKMLVDTSTKEVLVFKFKHEGSSLSLDTFISSLAQVQKESGIVFPLPDKPDFSKKIWASNAKNITEAKREVCPVN